MNEDNSIVRFRQPDEIDDPLTALLRSGARQLLEQAIEAEVAAFLASMKALKLSDGRDRLVRHGHGPERVIQTFALVGCFTQAWNPSPAVMPALTAASPRK